VARSFFFFDNVSRGESPFSGEGFSRDALAVLHLTRPQVDAIREALDSHSRAFLSRSDIQKLLKSTITESTGRKRVASFILNMDRLRRSWEGDEASFLIDCRAKILAETVTDETVRNNLDSLLALIPLLATGRPAIARQDKADAVAIATGRALEDVQVLCDLRPVFNQSRDRIEGFVAVTTMKLLATDITGLPTGLEVRLTEAQVSNLLDKLSLTTTKLSAIKEFVNAVGAEMTDTETGKRGK